MMHCAALHSEVPPCPKERERYRSVRMQHAGMVVSNQKLTWARLSSTQGHRNAHGLTRDGNIWSNESKISFSQGKWRYSVQR